MHVPHAITIARSLDMRGLPCPAILPTTRSALNEMRCGDLVEVLATDPRSLRDLTTWSEETGNALLESSQLGTTLRFVIRKS